MNALIALIQREPVILTNAAAAVIALAVAFGLPVTPDQKVAILGVVGLVATVVARSQVTPVAP